VLTLPSGGGTARGLRDSPLGKVAILVAILLVAFLASRSCASATGDIDQDEAIAIAKGQVDFEPEQVNVRFFRQGVPSRPFWAVSLTDRDESGAVERRTLIVVSAATGEVAKVDEFGR
jgi:hypothetical protein